MKVFIKGKGEIELKQQDFIASGGEASVYKKGNKAYKIYTDIHKMIPVGKIQELSCLTHPNIIKPEDVLLDTKNNHIGYNMKLVPKSYVLCQMFPKAFRQRENVSHQQAFEIVKKLQDIVKHCHDNKIIICDLNEMNVLLDDSFNEVYLIDVDSVKTPSYPATALMDSIRDRHAAPKIFNEGTDWFSFAIISFLTFIGIHPYKGKHPSIKDMDERMLKNISVLNKEVSIPPVCYDFSVIPSNYLKWYNAVLEQGKRVSPPFGNEIVQLVMTNIKTIVGNNNFDIQLIKDYLMDVYDYKNFPGVELVVSKKSIFINNKEFSHNDYKVISITPKKNHIILSKRENGKLKLFDLTGQLEIPCNIDADALMSYGGDLYIKTLGNIVMIKFIETGIHINVSMTIVCQTMEHATTFFDGVIFQNILSTYYATIIPKVGFTYQIKIKELGNYSKILDAKYDNNVLFVVAIDKKGKTDILILRFNEDYSEYDLRKQENITFTGLNFVVLEQGICININALEQLEVFTNKFNSTTIKVIDDKIINNDMRLFKNGTKVLFGNSSKIYSMKMK
jgi:serine/threonine protein kinase